MPLNPNERNILTITCFAHFVSHFNMLVFPAIVLPLTGSLNMELSAVLALSFWMYFLFGVTALPWGLLSDWLGAKPLLFVFFVGAGVCGLLSAGVIDSPGLFSLCLAGIGFFSGIYHPAGLGLISREISRMSMALGYNGMAGNAGLALAPLLTGIINYQFGIRAAYLCLGTLNLFGAALMLLLPTLENPHKQKTESQSSKTLIIGFAVMCLCVMLGGIAYRGVTVILPSYFELKNQVLFETLVQLKWFIESKNVAATALTSLVFGLGMFGQYMGGRAAERFDPRRGYLVFHSLALPMALAMAFLTDLPLILVTMLFFLFFLGMQPIENTIIAKLTPDRFRHSAYGTKFILTFGVGALGVHMVGWIKLHFSLSAVFVTVAGLSFLLVLSIILLKSVTRDLQFKG